MIGLFVLWTDHFYFVASHFIFSLLGVETPAKIEMFLF